MDDPNITMEEYIILKEGKAQRHGQAFNWKTATFEKVKYYEDEDDFFTDFETEFLAIVFDNTLTSDTALSCGPMGNPLNENEIDFRISLEESDDEDYTVIFVENLFSYKIISANDLKTDSENDKNNMPSSPKPTVDYLDDLDCFNDFKNEFPAIVYNDGLMSKPDLEIEPPDGAHTEVLRRPSVFFYEYAVSTLKTECLKFYNLCVILVDFTDMTPLPPRDQRHLWLRYQVEGFTKEIVHDFKQRLETLFDRQVNRVHVLDFEGLTPEMRQDLAVRLRMVDIGEFLSTFWMSDTEMGLDVADTLCFQLGEAGFGAYWGGSDRVILDKEDLRDYWTEISFGRDFLGPAPSYFLIRDHVRRLCHRMIAYSISVFGYADRSKSRARLSGGYFIGRLDTHFGLVSEKGLRGLQVITYELPLIDLHELERLNICLRFGDTWVWVAPGPERQQAAAVGAYVADKAGPTVNEGAQDIPAPVQAPQPPPPAPQPQTMSQRIDRIEKEMRELRQSVVGLRGVLMEANGRTYQPFDSTLLGSSGLPYQRHVRPRIGDASTSAALHIDDQPDP
nr:hypothetical protein [Tanacetum cinerariifolium]